MKEHIGKNCRLHLRFNNQDLFFTALPVLSVSDSHITFKDRDGRLFTFKLCFIAEISEIAPEAKFEALNGDVYA